MFKLDLEKAEEPDFQIANICWNIEKAREFQKNIHFCFIDYPKAFYCVHTNKLKYSERWEYHHLTCLLRYLYADQEATVRTEHEKIDWLQTGKGVPQGFILSPCLFNLFAEYIMQDAGWMNHKLELRLPGEISTTSDMQMISLSCRKWRGTKEPLDEGERGQWKIWLKTQHLKNQDHGIQSHNFVANRCETDLIFLGSKITVTVDSDCSHDIKTLASWKESYDKLDSVLKSRDITCQQRSI